MRPGLGAVALTLVIAISLVVQGAFRIGAALSARVDGWGSLLLSGIITLVLGLMIWNEWPFSGVWVIGFCRNRHVLLRRVARVTGAVLTKAGHGFRPLIIT